MARTATRALRARHYEGLPPEPCAEPSPGAGSRRGEGCGSLAGGGPLPETEGCIALPKACTDGQSYADGLTPLADLEERFEEDYVQHLAVKSNRQMCKYGAMGVGIGGALGLVAAPFVLPAVAVGALFAGGASGLQLARRKHRTERSRIPGSDTVPQMVSSRPSSRRLKFLVQWGHMKLLEYEGQPSEWSAKVLDDVVMGFSPWVQEVYLRSACRRVKAEVRESAVHLLPLYCFLQRTVCYMALVKSAELTTKAFEDGAAGAAGTPHLDSCLDRCRVVFPTVLETIATVERLNLASGAKTPGGVQVGRERLRRIAAAVRATLVRPAVCEALASGHAPRPAAGQPPSPSHGEETGSSLPDSPPEIDEDACSSEGGCDEEDYFSCSDADAPAPRRTASACSSGAAARAGFRRRSDAFPKGEGEHTWSPYCAEHFPVRSSTYLTDRRKEPSSPSLFELMHIDCVRIGEGGPVRRAARSPGFCPAFLRKSGDERFLFILNLTISPYQIVFCGAADLAAQRLSPQARDLFRGFCDMAPEERKKRFKMIVAIEEGPWLVRSLFPNTKKPVIIAKTVPMDSWYEPNSHFEVNLDIAAGKSWEATVSLVVKQTKRLVVTVAVLVEALDEGELPEVVLLSGMIAHLDTSLLQCPDAGEAYEPKH